MRSRAFPFFLGAADGKSEFSASGVSSSSEEMIVAWRRPVGRTEEDRMLFEILVDASSSVARKPPKSLTGVLDWKAGLEDGESGRGVLRFRFAVGRF